MRENEVKILEINQEEWIKNLEKLGAKKVGSFFQERYVYDFKPAKKGKWIRLRTNGIKSTLTIKEILNEKKIDGTRELEIVVSDFEKTRQILEELGYMPRSIEENKRTSYILGNVEIDIDTWPFIPTYVEIEGKEAQDVEEFLKKIEYDKEKLTTLDVESIYKEFYHIDMRKKVISFKEEENESIAAKM